MIVVINGRPVYSRDVQISLGVTSEHERQTMREMLRKGDSIMFCDGVWSREAQQRNVDTITGFAQQRHLVELGDEMIRRIFLE